MLTTAALLFVASSIPYAEQQNLVAKEQTA
jgi:hypothetical protein